MKKIGILKFYVVTIPLTLVLIFLLSCVLEFLGSDISEENPVDALPKEISFILVIFVAPILETIIYQYFPYKIINYLEIFKKDKVKKNFTIIASSIFFAISHPYSITYVLYSFLVGLIFISLYYFSYVERKDGVYSFWLIVIIHAIINTLAFYKI